MSLVAWAAARALALRRLSRRSPKNSARLTIGVVTRPFTFEGTRRAQLAKTGIEALKSQVDTLIVIPNDRLLQMADKRSTLAASFLPG